MHFLVVHYYLEICQNLLYFKNIVRIIDVIVKFYFEIKEKQNQMKVRFHTSYDKKPCLFLQLDIWVLKNPDNNLEIGKICIFKEMLKTGSSASL